MSKMFETGAYYHHLNEIDVAGISHATFLESEEITTEALKAFHEDHPKIQISLAFDKKGYGRTLRAHQGMDLVQECNSLLKHANVCVALPGDVELLKTFDLRALSALDVKIDLMAFDYSRPEQGSRTNFHTVLFSWEGGSIFHTLEYLQEQGINPSQISLGLARFGILFKNVLPAGSGYAQACEGPQLEKPEMSPEEIQRYLEKNPAAKLFYTSFKGCFQSFIYNQENGDWISFDDELTLKSKKEWARRHKLGGIFFYS